MLRQRAFALSRVALSHARFKKIPILPSSYRLTAQRFLSNEDLKETLRKVQEGAKKASEDSNNIGSEEAGKAEQKEGEQSETDKAANNNATKMPSFDAQKIMSSIIDGYYYFVDNVREAYKEMIGESKESALKRKLHNVDIFNPAMPKEEESEDNEAMDSEDPEKAAKEPPASAIVLVKEAKNPWEAMRDRLADSPFIKEILKRSRVVGQAAASTDLGKAAQNVGRSVKDKIEDAREFWETSQNPIVYMASGVWDSITGETEEGIAIAAIKKLDPKFNKEEWANEIRLNLAPKIIEAQLKGETKILKEWLSEAVFNKLSADIRTRKHDYITFDTNILQIDENNVIMRYLEDGGPIIVIIYMVQQINCVRKKGEIIEGSETDIRAKFYSMAFRQQFDETDATVVWKIVDYEYAGDIPYL